MEKREIKASWSDKKKEQPCVFPGMHSFYFYFHNFGSVLSEWAVGRKMALKWFWSVGSPLYRERERETERCFIIYVSLKHKALKHRNWLQPTRKLCHCHRDSTGCSMLLSAEYGEHIPAASWELLHAVCGSAPLKLLWHSCTDSHFQRAGREGGAGFPGDAGCR